MEFFENFGLHELVIGTAALLGVYSGIVIIRLARLSRPRAPAPVWKQDPAEFGQQVVNSGIEAELAELRGEVAALKEKVSLLEAARNVSPQYGEDPFETAVLSPLPAPEFHEPDKASPSQLQLSGPVGSGFADEPYDL